MNNLLISERNEKYKIYRRDVSGELNTNSKSNFDHLDQKIKPLDKKNPPKKILALNSDSAISNLKRLEANTSTKEKKRFEFQLMSKFFEKKTSS